MIEQLIKAGKKIVDTGMVKGWGGNLSGHYQAGVVITRSGADLGRLTRADFVVISPDITPEQLKALAPKPSSEVSVHLAAYRTLTNTRTILHVHPPKAISLGLLGHSLPALTPDFYLHLGAEVPLLPYMTPTTGDLAAAVAEQLQHAPALLMQNHGVIVVGQSVSQALLRLSLLEEQATIYLDALAVGTPRSLSTDDMQDLDEITGGRYKRHLT